MKLTDASGHEVPFETFSFPGGERHVRVKFNPHWQPFMDIRADIRSSQDVMDLLLLTDALRRSDLVGHIRLVMPYLPYARQDRVCVQGEALSLKVFTDLINAQGYSSVEVWDPHSDVATALINKLEVKPQSFFVTKIAESTDCVFVAPDAGATKKVQTLARLYETKMIQALKVRNPSTGEITNNKVIWPDDFFVRGSVMVVDDICDGGRTFVGLAENLVGAIENLRLYLYVTHGIFSSDEGLRMLSKLYTKVFVANPFRTDLPTNFEVIE